MQDGKLIIGFTQGDVNGIGPEILLKLFQDSRLLERMTPIIYCSAKAFFFYRYRYQWEKLNFHFVQHPGQAQDKRLNLIEVAPDFDRVEPGVPSTVTGKIAYDALAKAVEHLKAKTLDALVTLPIDKSTIQNDAFHFPGHTEYLANRFGVNDNLMLLVHQQLRVAVATGHIPIKDVAGALTVEGIFSKIRLMDDSLRLDFNIQRPKIAVLGLNPHAGDNGLLGMEEIQIINKSIQHASQTGLLVFGPFPADGFFASGNYTRFDGILAMYHDQGLIPFKTLAQGIGVNYTAGMPAIRTSPDHGTAYDIAGKNRADETSTREALYLAMDIYRTRTENLALAHGALKPTPLPAMFRVEDDLVRED